MLCMSVDLATGELDSQAVSPPDPISLPSGSRKVLAGIVLAGIGGCVIAATR